MNVKFESLQRHLYRHSFISSAACCLAQWVSSATVPQNIYILCDDSRSDSRASYLYLLPWLLLLPCLSLAQANKYMWMCACMCGILFSRHQLRNWVHLLAANIDMTDTYFFFYSILFYFFTILFYIIRWKFYAGVALHPYLSSYAVMVCCLFELGIERKSFYDSLLFLLFLAILSE